MRVKIDCVATRLRWLVSISVVTAVGAVPATAQATLVFARNPLKPTVWVARDDGSGQRRVARGSNPRISPDGQTIAFMRIPAGRAYRPELMVAPADGSAPPHRLIAGWREPFVFAWSPDSTTIATVRGPELGRKRLVLVDVASAAQNTVATGYFSGVSFAPEGGRLVYSRAAKETFPPRSDIYRFDVPLGEAIRYVGPVRLTRDHSSLSPLWGPGGQIVFVRQLGAKRRRYGPKNELFLMRPSGRKVRRLTHTRVDPLLFGLTPTDWSSDGSRLLAEFGGQDTSYAVTVNPRSGAQRTVGGSKFSNWFVGAALSADGSTILGSTGGFEPGRHNNVVRTPYGGGRIRVLARNGFEPDWSR